MGPGVIIGWFGNKFGQVRLRRSYLEVDLDEMRSANRLLELIGRDGGVATTFTEH